MGLEKNPHVFLDVSIDGDPVERIVIQVMRKSGIYLFSFMLERIFEVCLSILGWYLV